MLSTKERATLLSKLLEHTARNTLHWERRSTLPAAIGVRPLGPAYRTVYDELEFFLFRYLRETVLPTADIEPRVIGHERLRLVILDDGAPVAEIEDDSQLQSLFNRVRLGLSNAKARLAPLLDETVSSGAE